MWFKVQVTWSVDVTYELEESWLDKVKHEDILHMKQCENNSQEELLYTVKSYLET